MSIIPKSLETSNWLSQFAMQQNVEEFEDICTPFAAWWLVVRLNCLCTYERRKKHIPLIHYTVFLYNRDPFNGLSQSQI